MSRRNRNKNKSLSASLTINNSSMGVDKYNDYLNLLSNDAFIASIVEKNTTVSTCVDIISSVISLLDLQLFRKQKDGSYAPVKGLKHTEHLLNKPNAQDTQSSFIYKIVQSFVSFGAVYIVHYIDNTKGKNLKQFKVFQPSQVSPQYSTNNVLLGYQISGVSKMVPPEAVAYIHKPGINGSPQSAVRNALQEIVLNNSILKQSTNHIENGMMSRGVIIQKGEGMALSPAKANEISQDFSKKTSGANASNTIIMPKGLDYMPIAASAREAELIPLFEVSRKEIVRAIKIPESIYNSEAGASFATANIQQVNFYKNTIRPIVKFIEDAFNYFEYLTGETEYFKFDLDAVVAAEEEKLTAERDNVKANTASTLKAVGYYSPNEIRKASGHDPVKDLSGNPIEDADVNPLENPEVEPVEKDEVKELSLEDGLVQKKDLNINE